jgi:hypothetical protein
MRASAARRLEALEAKRKSGTGPVLVMFRRVIGADGTEGEFISATDAAGGRLIREDGEAEGAFLQRVAAVLDISVARLIPCSEVDAEL